MDNRAVDTEGRGASVVFAPRHAIDGLRNLSSSYDPSRKPQCRAQSKKTRPTEFAKDSQLFGFQQVKISLLRDGYLCIAHDQQVYVVL